MLVASSAPLDQFVVRNPSYFFEASPEHALINPDNLHILLDHVKCAAFELPFTTDERFGAEDVQQILGVLAEAGFVHLTAADGGGQWHWTHESYPADAVSLRSVSSDNFVIVDETDEPRVIGETDFTSGPSTLASEGHLPPGRAALSGGTARLRRTQGPRAGGRLRLLHRRHHVYARQRARDVSRPTREAVTDAAVQATRSQGEVHVVSRVVGFKKIKFYTNENVGSGELDLPEQQMHTTAYWLTVPREVMTALPYAADDRRDGIVGLSFALRQVAQLLLMCDRHDIGISIGGHGDDGTVPREAAERPAEPRIFIYDNYPGGIGFSEPLFRLHHELLAATHRLIASCECEFGCPTCVGPLGNVGPRAKAVALEILARVSA